MDTYVADGAACMPNISPAGRRHRSRIGLGAAIAAVALFVALVAAGAPWWARALVFLPTVVGATSLFQAQRNVCVMRAREGTFEHDDGLTTKMAAADLLGTRKVAATINRDGVLIALAAATLAVLTAFM